MTLRLQDGVRAHAEFSLDGRYRYTLWRTWDDSLPPALWIMLNPSTATEDVDDPTVRKVQAFSRAWGHGGACVANLFAFRATDPRVLYRCPEPVGPANDRWLRDLSSSPKFSRVVAAWGVHGEHRNRALTVANSLGDVAFECLGTTAGGHPLHPLYVPLTASPVPWDGR